VDSPPAGVAAQKGDVSAIFYKTSTLRRIASLQYSSWPTLSRSRVRRKEITKVLMYIEIGAIIDRELIAFEPADERRIPMPKSLARR